MSQLEIYLTSHPFLLLQNENVTGLLYPGCNQVLPKGCCSSLLSVNLHGTFTECVTSLGRCSTGSCCSLKVTSIATKPNSCSVPSSVLPQFVSLFEVFSSEQFHTQSLHSFVAKHHQLQFRAQLRSVLRLLFSVIFS